MSLIIAHLSVFFSVRLGKDFYKLFSNSCPLDTDYFLQVENTNTRLNNGKEEKTSRMKRRDEWPVTAVGDKHCGGCGGEGQSNQRMWLVQIV